MKNWRWDNPRAFGDQWDCSNPLMTQSGKGKRTVEHFSWYGSDDLSPKIEPPSCRKYNPAEFLAVRSPNCNEMFVKDDDDEDWADPGEPSSERSRRSDGNDNDDSESEHDTKGSETGTGPGKGS